AARSRNQGCACAISSDRRPYAPVVPCKVCERSGIGREGGIFVNARVRVAAHGSQKHSNHGESDRKLGQRTKRGNREISKAASGSIRDVHRATVGSDRQTRLRENPGRCDGKREKGWCERAQGVEDAGSVFAGESYGRYLGED